MKLDLKPVFIYVIIGLILLGVYFYKPATKSNDMSQYLESTSDFDYKVKSIQDEANYLKTTSKDVVDQVKNTIQFTYSHVQYDGEVTVPSCVAETASSVLSKGTGDCVSMSRLNVALLRAQGIPARTVGGCGVFTKMCTSTFSITGVPDPLIPTSSILDNKKRGGLHEWVEVYYNGDWHIIESTSGTLYSKDCQKYVFNSYDSNPLNRCIISDNTFVSQCRTSQ